MAFRIHRAIVRGEITNEVPGIVTGRLWLTGRPQPLVLQLKGNCQRDLAGCSLSFHNPNPQAQNLDGLCTDQEGTVGVMTASKKERLPTVSEEELVQLLQKHEPIPSRFANCLYLEWFSKENGRVVVETDFCELSISEARWVLPASEDGSDTTYDPAVDDEVPGDPDPFGLFSEFDELDQEDVFDDAYDEDEEPLNEFEWEQELREADRRVDAYQEALETYRDHMDQEQILGKVMGWDSDEIDNAPPTASEVFGKSEGSDTNGGGPGSAPSGGAEENDAEISDKHHRLTEHAMNLALKVQHAAEQKGLISVDDAPDDDENPIFELVRSTIQLGGKLAAALDGLANGVDPEPGFIIAMLKRSLQPLNAALGALQDASQQHAGGEGISDWLTDVRNHLFGLRKEIIDLMGALRSENDEAF